MLFLGSIQVSYAFIIFVCALLTIMVIRGVTLDGAKEGILFYVTPEWTVLMNGMVITQGICLSTLT